MYIQSIETNHIRIRKCKNVYKLRYIITKSFENSAIIVGLSKNIGKKI